MGEETLPREEVSQNLNAETSESQQSKPKKAIPGAPENATLSEPIARQRNAVIDYDNIPTQFISNSLKTEDAIPPVAASNKSAETTPNLSETTPQKVKTPATPAPASAELATAARAEKVATLKNKLENLGRGEEWTFFSKKYAALLNKPAADADFSDLDNNLQKLSNFLAKDQKFEITKVGNLQIRIAGLPILEEYYAAWLQSKNGNAKNEGLAKALDLRRQIAQTHPEVSTQIQAIEYNSGNTDQGKKFAYLRLLAGYAPKETENTDNQHLNQYGIDDRLATNDQDTTKSAQKAVQQKSPEQNAPPTAWDKYKNSGSPQKAEQDIEKNIQKLPVKAQNGGGKKTDKSDPKNPQQSQPNPLQALWSLVDKLESDKQQSPNLTTDQESILQSLKILGKAGVDASASVAKGVKSLYNTLTGSVDLPAEEYVDFMGKGGTIYVHIMSKKLFEQSEMLRGKKVKFSKQDFLNAEKESNERLKALDINLRVKMVFDLGEKPMNKKQFQSRKDYNPMDSYIMVTGQRDWNEFRDGQQSPIEDRWNDVNSKLPAADPALSAGLEFLALIDTNFAESVLVETMLLKDICQGFGGAKDLVELYDEAEKKGKSGRDAVFSRMLSRLIEHESAHPKFNNDPDDDSKSGGLGGHVKNTIMQEGIETANVEYSVYQQTILQLLHGKISKNALPDTGSIFSDAQSVMESRTDLPKR